jgi:hypothetical protein
MPGAVDLRVAHAAVVNMKRIHSHAVRVGDVFNRTWMHLGGPTDEDAASWLRFAVPTMRGAKTQTAYSQLAYTKHVAHTLDLPRSAQLDVPAIVGDSLADRYIAPVINLRSSLSEGTPFADALAQAGRLVEGFARTDIAEVAQESAVAAMADTPGITHYRRVPSDLACDFCLLISGQRYTTDDLAPSHKNCTCGIGPITEESDPTFERQRALSKDLYADEQRVADAQTKEADLSSEEGAPA